MFECRIGDQTARDLRQSVRVFAPEFIRKIFEVWAVFAQMIDQIKRHGDINNYLWGAYIIKSFDIFPIIIFSEKIGEVINRFLSAKNFSAFKKRGTVVDRNIFSKSMIANVYYTVKVSTCYFRVYFPNFLLEMINLFLRRFWFRRFVYAFSVLGIASEYFINLIANLKPNNPGQIFPEFLFLFIVFPGSKNKCARNCEQSAEKGADPSWDASNLCGKARVNVGADADCNPGRRYDDDSADIPINHGFCFHRAIVADPARFDQAFPVLEVA